MRNAIGTGPLLPAVTAAIPLVFGCGILVALWLIPNNQYTEGTRMSVALFASIAGRFVLLPPILIAVAYQFARVESAKRTFLVGFIGITCCLVMSDLVIPNPAFLVLGEPSSDFNELAVDAIADGLFTCIAMSCIVSLRNRWSAVQAGVISWLLLFLIAICPWLFMKRITWQSTSTFS